MKVFKNEKKSLVKLRRSSDARLPESGRQAGCRSVPHRKHQMTWNVRRCGMMRTICHDLTQYATPTTAAAAASNTEIQRTGKEGRR